MDMISEFFGKPGHPVPPVDAEDLKIVCEFLGEMAREHSKGGVGIHRGVYQQLSKPGADIPAVTHRAAMLRLLTTPTRSQEFNASWKKQLAPWTHDGHIDSNRAAPVWRAHSCARSLIGVTTAANGKPPTPPPQLTDHHFTAHPSQTLSDPECNIA